MVETNSNHPLAQSLDSIAERVELLKKIFPDVISEGQIDFNRLKAALGDSTAQTNERYELSWAGKSDARREIQKRTTATLRPDTANSVHWDATQNIYIEGENLEVLRTLQKAYFGKVKMIYIDPPYNTGSDSFVYPDDYSERLAEYRARTGQTDEAGFVNKQDMWKKNSKENGQFHSVWLSMMYPRLFLARNLLREDGVIAIHIDDNELTNLQKLCDELFGEENFISCVVVKMSHLSGMKMSHVGKKLPKIKEFILLYGKNKEKIKLNKIVQPCTWKEAFDRYTRVINDVELDPEKWEFTTLRECLKSIPPDKQDNWCISNAHRIIRTAVNDGLPKVMDGIYRSVTTTTGINKISYNGEEVLFASDKLEKVDGKIQPVLAIGDIWTDIGINNLHNEGGVAFENGKKPLKLLRRIIQLSDSAEKDDLVFDFFSGSGTTAQAVLELNEEDGGNRQFICVQMPEKLDESTDDSNSGYKTIADIGRARIKKVIESIDAKRLEESKQGTLEVKDEPKQSLGFNAFKLAPSNFKEWRTEIENEEDLLAQMEYHLDSTKPDSLPQSMVYELLLKLSLPITTPIVCHTIQDEQQVYVASPKDAKPVAMFFTDVSAKITAFILKTKPSKVVCLNKAFADSQALTNFSLQLKDADISFEVL